MAIICEPYIKNNKISVDNNTYLYYISNRTAVVVKKCITHKHLVPENNIISIQMSNYLLIGCYLSPNKERETHLQKIDIIIKNNPRLIPIVIGDRSSDLQLLHRQC